MSENDNHARWHATVVYRTNSGSCEVLHDIEEIGDLHDIVERGPDWNSIIHIRIALNPWRRSSPNITVEESQNR